MVQYPNIRVRRFVELLAKRSSFVSVDSPSPVGRRRTAVVITGNPYYVGEGGVQREQAEPFYSAIEEYLRRMGYETRRDPGLEKTVPPDADLWVAHSRGGDRLRFAPTGTKTLLLDAYESPLSRFVDRWRLSRALRASGYSDAAEMPVEERPLPGKRHYRFNRAMQVALRRSDTQ